jgi:DNA-binding transcriptional regulator YdaS (Cro superfamily)
MKLGLWLLSSDLNQKQFAGLIGVSQSEVSRYVNGLRIPPPAAMVAIVRATRQQVRPEDFYNLPEARPRRPSRRPHRWSVPASTR